MEIAEICFPTSSFFAEGSDPDQDLFNSLNFTAFLYKLSNLHCAKCCGFKQIRQAPALKELLFKWKGRKTVKNCNTEK